MKQTHNATLHALFFAGTLCAGAVTARADATTAPAIWSTTGIYETSPKGLVVAQSRLGTNGLPTREKRYLAESIEGSFTPDTPTSAPVDLKPARVGIRVRQSFAFPPKATLDYPDFGGAYRDPNWWFYLTLNPRFEYSWTRLERSGFTMANMAILRPEERDDPAKRPDRSRMIQDMSEQSVLPESMRHLNFQLTDLVPFATAVYEHMGVDPRFMYFSFNIEQSGLDTGLPRSDQWNSLKDRTIICELDGKTRTLDALNAEGLFDSEMTLRWVNRRVLLVQILRDKSPDTQVAWDTAIWQGWPFKQYAERIEQTPVTARANVRALTGRNDDSFTFTASGKTHELTIPQVTAFGACDFEMHYQYVGDVLLRGDDFNAIYTRKDPDTQNYSYLWSKWVAADTLIYNAAQYEIEQEMMARPGVGKKRMIMQRERNIEFIVREVQNSVWTDGYAKGVGVARDLRVPFAELQNTIIYRPDDVQTPKAWIPPSMMYDQYITARFLMDGFYLFNEYPDLNPGHPQFNHELHSVPALFQGVQDMLPYERFIGKSTLVLNPAVQLGGEGAFTNYTKVEGANMDLGGTCGPMKSAYCVRYLPEGKRIRVLIIGQAFQDHDTSRTDIIRVDQKSPLKATTFRLTLTGGTVHLFEFLVTPDQVGQTFEVGKSQVDSWAPRGYAGRVTLEK